MPFGVDADDFALIVEDAMRNLPHELRRHIDNVILIVDDASPPGDVLGLYEGVPLTERSSYGGLDDDGTFSMPDRVTLYRRTICESCDSLDEVHHEVMVTLVHELSHHVGIDDDRLHELGWG